MKRWPRGQREAEWVELLPVHLSFDPSPVESVPVGLRLLANGDGVVVADVPRRVLGYRQLRERATMLLEAADFAESRGCPDYVRVL